jgi:hypothetical protein
MSASMLDNTALLGTLIAFRRGDFSVRLPYDLTGLEGKVADTINDIFDMNLRLREELARLSSTVGKEGRISERAALPGAVGDWTECVDSLNDLIGDMVRRFYRSRARDRRGGRRTCRDARTGIFAQAIDRAILQPTTPDRDARDDEQQRDRAEVQGVPREDLQRP